MEKIIDDSYLKPEELKNGYLYQINARNSDCGIWIRKHGGFVISRFKFGHNFLFVECHWDLDKWHGTVRPLKLVEKAPFNPAVFHASVYGLTNAVEDEVLKYLNSFKPRQIEGRWPSR